MFLQTHSHQTSYLKSTQISHSFYILTWGGDQIISAHTSQSAQLTPSTAFYGQSVSAEKGPFPRSIKTCQHMLEIANWFLVHRDEFQPTTWASGNLRLLFRMDRLQRVRGHCHIWSPHIFRSIKNVILILILASQYLALQHHSFSLTIRCRSSSSPASLLVGNCLHPTVSQMSCWTKLRGQYVVRTRRH